MSTYLKYRLLFILIITSIAGAEAQSNKISYAQFTVKGTINGTSDTSVTAYYCKGKDTIVNTFRLIGNREIYFKGNINEPTKIHIDERGIVYNISTASWDSKIIVWVEPGKETRFSYQNTDHRTAADGNNSQLEQNDFDRQFQVTLDAQQNIIKRGREAKTNGSFSEIKPKLDFQWDSIEVSKRNIITGFIKRHPSSFVSLSLFKDYMYCFKNYNKADSLIAVFKILNDKVKASESGKRIQEFLGLDGKVKIGAQLPEIAEKDTAGNYLKISSFRGKYLLIDFWASWCVPCRQQIPELKRLFDKYKDRSFAILSISIDNDRSKWIQAIKEDKVDWPNISDLKATNGAAAQIFNIREIPHLFLIDPEGKIISKDLSVGDINKKLETLIPN